MKDMISERFFSIISLIISILLIYTSILTAQSLGRWEQIAAIHGNAKRSPSIANTARHFVGAEEWSTVVVFTVGDGAEWRCRDDKPIKLINVRCSPYNAVPDDNMDDSKAFQTAVNALPSSGGVIIVPPGAYLFDNPLVVQKPVHILGAGSTTILTHNNDLSTDGEANFIRIGGAISITEDVIISNLTLQGRQTGSIRTTMIRIVNNVRRVKIHNVLFKNVSSTCILIFGKNTQDIYISYNRADEFYEQFVELASGGITGVHIEHNIAKSTSGHPKLGPTQPFGIIFESKGSGEITDVSIVDNVIIFEGMSKADLINTGGISLSEGDPAPYLYRRIYILGNTIRKAGVGIRVQTLRSGAVSGPGSVVIAGNYIEGAEADGILVSPANDTTHHDIVSIIENVVRGYSAHKVNLYDGIRLDGIAIYPEIKGNQILPLAKDEAGRGRYGISIGAGIRNATIAGNKIAGYQSGAVFNKASSSKIVGNR